jgi:hypothetical protein
MPHQRLSGRDVASWVTRFSEIDPATADQPQSLRVIGALARCVPYRRLFRAATTVGRLGNGTQNGQFWRSVCSQVSRKIAAHKPADARPRAGKVRAAYEVPPDEGWLGSSVDKRRSTIQIFHLGCPCGDHN